jgi:Ca-activated chloride channel family protein
MENIKPRHYSYVFILALALLVTACGSSTERRIEEGNQAFQDEAYLVALQSYKEAEAQSPDLAEPHYNAANALYKEGAFADASTEFSSALDLVEHADLEEYSLFNLGNTAYNLDDLAAAIAAYTEALLLDPEDQYAKYNLELAQLSQEQQEQEQNEEQNEEQDENESDSPEENQDQGDGEESEENSDSKQGDPHGSDEEPSSGDESDEGSEQSNDPGQQEDSQKDDGRDGDKAEVGSPDQSNGIEQEDDGKGQSGSYILEPGERMSEEQARQLLAAIAGNSETLMEKLEQIFFVPFGAPIQDW